MGSAVSKGRVLIVDDQFLIVEFLRIWSEAHGFEICGTASTAAGAVQAALEHKPDCILMDVRLEGDKDGIDYIPAQLTNGQLRACQGDGIRNEDFFGFGMQVYAQISGLVMRVKHPNGVIVLGEVAGSDVYPSGEPHTTGG